MKGQWLSTNSAVCGLIQICKTQVIIVPLADNAGKEKPIAGGQINDAVSFMCTSRKLLRSKLWIERPLLRKHEGVHVKIVPPESSR